MPSDTRNIAIISFSLGILYLVSSFVYLLTAWIVPYRIHSSATCLVFLSLFFICFAVLKLKDWARRILVKANIFLCFYWAVLNLRYPSFIDSSYILLCVIVAAYFSQRRIVLWFQPQWRTNRKTVLVIDDDETFVKMVQKVLLPNGFSILVAPTGEKGLQIAFSQKPDVILLDVILPGIKGRDVCATLKDDPSTQDIPVIFLTSKNSTDDIKAEMAVGAFAHMTKPVDAKTLLGEIKRALS